MNERINKFAQQMTTHNHRPAQWFKKFKQFLEDAFWIFYILYIPCSVLLILIMMILGVFYA